MEGRCEDNGLEFIELGKEWRCLLADKLGEQQLDERLHLLSFFYKQIAQQLTAIENSSLPLALPQLAVHTLLHLQPLLFYLRTRGLVAAAIFDIVPPVGIRRQRRTFMLDGQGHHLVQIKHLHSLVDYILIPKSTHLAQAAQSLFFIWLTPFPSKKLGHEFLTDFPNSSFKIITGLLLFAYGKEALAIGIKSEFEDYIC